jgi:hypothetical protein
MLSGRLPFESDGSGEIIGAHQFVPPPPLRSRAPGCSPAAEMLVAQLLAKARTDRVQTAQDLLRLAAPPLFQTGGRGDPPPIRSGATSPGALASTPPVSAASAVTTLGGVAGVQRMTMPRRRGWIVGGTAVVVLAAVVAVAGVMSTRTQGRAADAALDDVAAAAAGMPGADPTRREGAVPRPSGSVGVPVAPPPVSPPPVSPPPVSPSPVSPPPVSPPPVTPPQATARAVTPPVESTPATDASGPDPVATPASSVKTARPRAVTVPLNVTTVPAGAEVAVDGKPLGPSPIHATIARSAAPARIMMSHKGYETRVVTVRRNGPIDLEIQLSPKPRAKQADAPPDKNRTVNPFDD